LAAFEEWLIQRITRWHKSKGQKRLLSDEITKRLTLSRRVQSAAMDDLMDWTFERDTPEKFTKHVRKHMHNGTLPAEEARRLLEKAGQKLRVSAVNDALRRAISRHEYAAYWHRRSVAGDADYYPAQKALREAKLWVPEYREEKKLTKYMKHP
jgi:hypothetical protein